MRLLLVCVAMAMLSACNVVMTKDPMFTRADKAGAPPFRPGVWDQDVKADCQVDERQPIDKWPSCAKGFVVKADGTMGSYLAQGDKPVWSSTGFVLAAGEPRIFQIHLSGDIGGLPLAPVYLYAGLVPTRFDDQGRIVAGTSWGVICGPPPPPDAKAPDGRGQRMGTLHPFPGLTMDSSGSNCAAETGQAVREAAVGSRKLAKPDDLSGSHWVRDGDR